MTATLATNFRYDYKYELNRWGKDYSQDAKDKVYVLVKGYRIRHGILDTIRGVCYRVWNYVKSFFVRSDWGKAVDILCDESRPHNMKGYKDMKKYCVDYQRTNNPENFNKWKTDTKEFFKNVKEMASYGSPDVAQRYLNALVTSIDVEGLKK